MKLPKPLTFEEIVDRIKETRIAKDYRMHIGKFDGNPAIVFNEINYPDKTRATLFVRREERKFDNKYETIEYIDLALAPFPYFLFWTKLGREIRKTLTREEKNEKCLVNCLNN